MLVIFAMRFVSFTVLAIAAVSIVATPAPEQVVLVGADVNVPVSIFID